MSAMCMADGGETSEVYCESIRVAHKSHVCLECRREIRPGEKYEVAKSLYEGRWYECKTCSHCLIAKDWLAENCGGWLHHAMIEDLQEHISEYPKLGYGLARVVVGARRKWRSFTDPSRLLPVQPLPGSIAPLMVEGNAQ